jgi:NADH:ubiquinone oxidoreductase subunit C
VTQVETLVETLENVGVKALLLDQSGVSWFSTEGVDPRRIAEVLLRQGARFITITTYELPKDQGFRLEYLWDLDGKLLGFAFAAGKTMPSIYDICEGADWIEREIHEEFSIDFEGRCYEPLLLREGDRKGVNLREVTQ